MAYTMDRSRAPGRNTAGEFSDSSEDYGVPILRTGASVTDTNLQATALESGSVVIDKSLSRIFVAAYLLTGSAKQAEAVVSETIQELDINATRDGRLSWKTIVAASMRVDPDSQQAPNDLSAALPVELQRVLRLSPHLRQCFVLRVLMAMPRHYCAGLLRIEAEQVDANSSLAAQELATIVAGAAAN